MATAVSNVKGGIPGLAKVLRQLPKAAADNLRTASQAIAGDVAGDARGRAERIGGVARHVAPSIRSTRDRVPVIKLGGRGDMAAAFGAEYGGRRRPTTQQFAPWRGSGRGAGYFLWPTIHANNREINDRYSEALLRALREIR